MRNIGVDMSAKMNDFLLQYYMQYRFNHMPPEVRAQFDVFVKSDDFRGNMKTWKSKLMHQDASGKWVENNMPDPLDSTSAFFMEEGEWKKLFIAFQNAFRSMSADRERIEKTSPDAVKFLDEYFGNLPSQIFSNSVASGLADDIINNGFKNFLNTYKTRLEIQFQNWGIIDKDFTYSQLLSGIASKKYNSSPSFQKKIKTIAQYIDAYSTSEEFRNVLRLSPGDTIPDFSPIINGFDDDRIDTTKMDLFKGNANVRGDYLSLLNTLVKNKKIYDVFKQYDDGKISGKLEEANSKLEYDKQDSKDYVPPKRTEELTFFQKLKGDVSDTIEDYLDKYLKLSGDRLYFSESAKLIIKAIGKSYKPTEGLDKILEKKSDITKNLMYKSPRATDHFDWFVKTMEELKSSMPKTFAGALKNGRQLKAIVEELILKAVRENEIDEAKTAMEILSVVKYGYTNSKIMEAFNKSDLTIFSDKGLSWNKNEGVKFVTTAFDYTIKKGLQAVGYTLTGLGNMVRLSGSKFNGQANRIRNVRNQWTASNTAERIAAEQRRNTENLLDQSIINAQQAILANLNAAGVNAASMPQKKSDLRTAKDEAQMAEDAYTQAANVYDEKDYIVQTVNKVNSLMQEMEALNSQIVELEKKFKDPNTYTGLDPAAASALANDIMRQGREKHAEGQEKLVRYQELNNLLQQIPQAEINDAVNNIGNYQQAMINAEQNRNAKHQVADTLETQINEFETATELVQEATSRITQRDEEMRTWDDKHKDNYKELVAFWDMLETGRNLHMGKFYSWSLGSAKNKQRAFDNVKIGMLNQYTAGYSLAA